MAENKQAVLSGRKLFIAIPAYDGKINIKLAYNVAALMPKAMQHGIAVSMGDVSGCSIITMARNQLVHEFLKSDCTELLFIDSDVIATPDGAGFKIVSIEHHQDSADLQLYNFALDGNHTYVANNLI